MMCSSNYCVLTLPSGKGADGQRRAGADMLAHVHSRDCGGVSSQMLLASASCLIARGGSVLAPVGYCSMSPRHGQGGRVR